MEGRMLMNRYELLRKAGVGGMGTVYIARDTQLDRMVALKLMSAALAEDPSARQRFLREAQAAGRLQSPHVVQVLDYGVDGQTPYMVMELLVGEDLGVRLKRVGRLPAPVLLDLIRQLSKGLRIAHEAGFVHRDLKPGNLFMARVDDDETLKILDFGVAKHLGSQNEADATQSGILVGSVRYMAPEQARGRRNIDHRADVWSVGVILFRALSGAMPFQGETDTDLIIQICTSVAPKISSVDPSLRAFDGFFTKALAPDVEARFASIGELFGAFARAATGNEPNASDSGIGPNAEHLRHMNRTMQLPPVGKSTVAMNSGFGLPPSSAVPFTPIPSPALSPDPTVRGSSVNALPNPQKKGVGAYVAVGAAVGLLAVSVIGSTAYLFSRDPASASQHPNPNTISVPVTTQGASTSESLSRVEVQPTSTAAQPAAVATATATATATPTPTATPTTNTTASATGGPAPTGSSKKVKTPATATATAPIKTPPNPF